MIGSQALKTSLAWGTVVTGTAALARRRRTGTLRILMYHGVVPRREGPAAFGDLFMSERAFARQMRHLTRAYTVISLDDVMDTLETRGSFPDRAVLVTFDDGYRNTVQYALPILRSLGLPAAVFVTPALVGTQDFLWFDALRVLVAHGAVSGLRFPDPTRGFAAWTRHVAALPRGQREAVCEQITAACRTKGLCERHPEFALATWDDWRHALDGGRLSIGSHGLRHGDLLAMTLEEQLDDLRRSKCMIEQQLGRPCRAVAYPHGRWNAQVARAAEQAGYTCGVTTVDGLNTGRADRFALRRTMIGDQGNFHLFCARVSGVWDRLRDAARR